MDTSSNTTNNNSSRTCMQKRRRRATKSRKGAKQGLINMAEARREIVNALQLHRRSSSKPSKLVEMNPSAYIQNPINRYSPLLIPHVNEFSSCVSNDIGGGDEKIEFEWPETDRSFSSSSYTWWSSFLDSMDKNNVGCSRGVVSSFKKVENNCGANYYVDLGNTGGEGRVNVEAPFMENNGNDQNPFLDEWLIVPTAKEEEDI